MFFQKKSTKIIATLVVIAIVFGMLPAVIAQEPYISYGYDWFFDTHPSQSAYIVDRVITSNEMNLAIPMNKPEDLFVYEDEESGEIIVIIVDTGNNRLIITDENFDSVRIRDEFYYSADYQAQNFLLEDTPEYEARVREEFAKIGKVSNLKNPTGIFVNKSDDGIRLFIADQGNERVIMTDLSGGILMEYTKPETTTYAAESFSPSKVLVDNGGNVYVCVKNITSGSVKFSATGNFLGFFGANRVTRTSDAILNYFLRFVLTKEQMLDRTRPTPVEFSNFTIDNDQFIYTVTEKGTTIDIVKKISPAGRNIFANQGIDDSFIWGDYNSPRVGNKVYTSLIIDISIDHNGDIYIFDRESGKIFQYDQEGHLMFIFGGKGEQKGLFVDPKALETLNGRVYALDATKNSVTVFKLTEFGGLVTDAMAMFNRGLYTESLQPWEEVLRRDANYYMAYVGMGNAKLSVGEFEESLKYFYMHSRGGYGRAFKDFRIDFIRNNFDRMLAIALIAIGVAIAGATGIDVLRKKKKAKELYALYN
ncbi:MAG: hypothetical protein FWG83_02165 [Oscillospiraceae bacterium]|nr:hypothetical protein [Oscillospiraceae bacterium]